MKFLLAAAGTAGHINPALAIAGELRSLLPDAEFLFVGADRAMENRLVPREGYRLENLHMTGVARGRSLADLRHNVTALRELIAARKRADEIIRSFAPDAVIGTGGYVCWPVARAAAARGVPTVLHESNAEPGLANRLLSDRVTRVLVAFPHTEDRYKKPERVVYTGTPVRGDFEKLTRQEARQRLGLSPEEPLVVSFWGSLGASRMNDMMADFIAAGAPKGHFRHIHATGGGEEGLEKMRDRLRQRGLERLPEKLDLRAYINDMGLVMTAADVILCRAGASTLAELTNLGRAAILVPSPNVTANHQEKNATALMEGGGAVMVREAEASGERLLAEVEKLLADPQRRRDMELCSANMGMPDARKRIASLILDLVTAH